MSNELQKRWYGHGVLMILATLLGGVGYWMFLLHGFELVPGTILHFDLPGTADGWRRAHTGPAMNGLMVIAVAAVLPALDFSEAKARMLGWFIVADGWANVCFYFAGNFAPNRGLSFGANSMGDANIFSVIALGPAYLFGVIAVGVLATIGWHGVRSVSRGARPSSSLGRRATSN
jgi:styrene-oxide isomerase